MIFCGNKVPDEAYRTRMEFCFRESSRLNFFFRCKILFANNLIRSEIHTLIMRASVDERGQYYDTFV